MQDQELSTEIVQVDGREQLVLAGAELRVKSGPDRGARLELSNGVQQIGTAPSCDLVLSDRSVSAHHAEVAATSRGYLLRDRGSKNGVRLQRWRVERVYLSPRMRLFLGETELEVRSTSKEHTVPLQRAGAVGELEAHSVEMRAVAAMVDQVAEEEFSILIEGETGTGKEVVARTIHDLGSRANGPFVVVDLPAIPASLLVAELFGHERGAFSGADIERAGLFAEASGGTLFLDEIGELPLEVQPVLLRAVDQRMARRVGGNREIPFDVRIVSATNRNLAEEVRAGRFRQDLFYRLAVARLRVPPLRARAEDIPPLARRFAEEEGCVLTSELTRVLLQYDWPGNVRELRNVIARVAVASDLDALGLPAPAGQPVGEIAKLNDARRQAVWEFEQRYLDQVLALSGGNISAAARLAGVSRSFLSRLASRHKRLARDRAKSE